MINRLPVLTPEQIASADPTDELVIDGQSRGLYRLSGEGSRALAELPTLDGPLELQPNIASFYTITNYDALSTYSAAAVNAVVSLEGNQLQLTPNANVSSCQLTIIQNGLPRTIDIPVATVEITGTYTQLATPSANPKYGLTAAGEIDGQLYFIGADLMLRYDIETDTWSGNLTEPLTDNRLFSAGVVNNQVIMAGGLRYNGGTINNKYLATYLYDPASAQWTATANLPQVQYGSGFTVYNDELWIVNGRDNRANAFKQLRVYQPDTASWTAKASPSHSLYFTAVTGHNGKLYAFGGTNGSTASTAFICYDIETDTWSTIAAQGPSARYGAAFVTHLDKLYLFGGSQAGSASDFNDLWCYDPGTEEWTQLPSGGVPGGMTGAISTVTGIYVCGSYSGSGSPNKTLWKIT